MSICTSIVFSCHSLDVPCFLLLARPYITGQQFSFYASRMGDASCGVVAKQGKSRRWSPPWCCDTSQMCLLARVYHARPSAILHFLLSQPSHASSFLPPFVDRNEGVTTKNVGDFSKKLPRFSDYLPRFFSFAPTFFKIASAFTKNLLFRAVPALAVFLAFCLLFFLYFLALQHSNIKECL